MIENKWHHYGSLDDNSKAEAEAKRAQDEAKRAGDRLLLAAIRQDATAVAAEIRGSKTDVDSTSPTGKTALYFAASNGNIECARALLDAGAKVNSPEHGGYSPLHVAVLTRNRAMSTLMLAKQTPADKCAAVMSMLCHALSASNWGMIECLCTEAEVAASRSAMPADECAAVMCMLCRALSARNWDMIEGLCTEAEVAASRSAIQGPDAGQHY